MVILTFCYFCIFLHLFFVFLFYINCTWLEEISSLKNVLLSTHGLATWKFYLQSNMVDFNLRSAKKWNNYVIDHTVMRNLVAGRLAGWRLCRLIMVIHNRDVLENLSQIPECCHIEFCCKIAYESWQVSDLPIYTHNKAVLSKDMLIMYKNFQLNHINSHSNNYLSILVFSIAFPVTTKFWDWKWYMISTPSLFMFIIVKSLLLMTSYMLKYHIKITESFHLQIILSCFKYL